MQNWSRLCYIFQILLALNTTWCFFIFDMFRMSDMSSLHLPHCSQQLLFIYLHISFFSGGYVSNSLAIMTDAVHMLTDVLGILFSLLALWLSTKPPSKKFTFGLHRLGESHTVTLLFDFYLFVPSTFPQTHVKQNVFSH